MQARSIGPVLGLFLMMNVIAADAWATDIYILESNVDRLKVGDTVSDQQLKDLPKDGRVRVLLLPENKTKLIEGAEAGQSSDPKKQVGGARGMK